MLLDLFKKHATESTKGTPIVIRRGDIESKQNADIIYNYDDAQKPIVLTIPKGQTSIALDEDKVASMVQFLLVNFPESGLKQSLEELGEVAIRYIVGKYPKVMRGRFDFDWQTPEHLTRDKYLTQVILLNESTGKSISLAIFFYVEPEDKLGERFNKS